MTQHWLPQRDDQYYSQKLHLRVCKRSKNRPSAAAATAAVRMHSRCLIYRKIVQYLRRTFSLPSTCTCVTIEVFFCKFRRSSEGRPAVYIPQSFPFFVIFSYNGGVIDVALSFRSADKLRYQS